MKEIVERLAENKQVERAKSILESNGYKVTNCNESSNVETSYVMKMLIDSSHELSDDLMNHVMEELDNKLVELLKEANIEGTVIDYQLRLGDYDRYLYM